MPQDDGPRIRVGIGGWSFAPWRGTFYPQGLPAKRELEYASRRLTSIEINATYYRSQTPATFAKWRDETPDDFVFAVKGPRYASNQRVLAEAGASVERFLTSGVMVLGDKLGPINWQFPPTKKFDPEDFDRFLGLLPASVDGRPLRHAVEVRHGSFRTPDFVALARAHGIAIVLAAGTDYPQIADVTAPFVYARITVTSEAESGGYADEAPDAWAERARTLAAGRAPEGLATVAPGAEGQENRRDVFLYVIGGQKDRNPAAAQAIIENLQEPPQG